MAMLVSPPSSICWETMRAAETQDLWRLNIASIAEENFLLGAAMAVDLRDVTCLQDPKAIQCWYINTFHFITQERAHYADEKLCKQFQHFVTTCIF